MEPYKILKIREDKKEWGKKEQRDKQKTVTNMVDTKPNI